MNGVEDPYTKLEHKGRIIDFDTQNLGETCEKGVGFIKRIINMSRNDERFECEPG